MENDFIRHRKSADMEISKEQIYIHIIKGNNLCVAVARSERTLSLRRFTIT